MKMLKLNKKGLIAACLATVMALPFAGCTSQSASSAQSSSTPSASSAAAPVEITVFAAASLTESFSELGRDILKSDNISVKFDFAGSQALVQSVEQGTSADVLAFASESYMKEMKTKGYVDSYSIFAKNTLVACKLKSNSKTLSSLADLAKSGVNIIAGDKSVPCGSYFDKVVTASKLTDAQKKAVNANIKSKEMSVKDVVAKIQSGNGDFGIVYTTDITTAVNDSVEEIKLPEFNAAKPKYPIAAVKNSKQAEAANKFIDLVLSDKGKAVLKKYKFITE
jgi:molybdate transport system substrate-binding protein